MLHMGATDGAAININVSLGATDGAASNFFVFPGVKNLLAKRNYFPSFASIARISDKPVYKTRKTI
jgi:hypothetical protein